MIFEDTLLFQNNKVKLFLKKKNCHSFACVFLGHEGISQSECKILMQLLII